MAEKHITKAIRIPVSLMSEIETSMVGQETDFSKFCRTAIRSRLNRKTDGRTYLRTRKATK